MERLNKFLNESQDPRTVEKIMNRINELMTAGEKVEYVAVQKKPAVNVNPASIALTNKRIVFCRPRNLGLSMDFDDYLWKEVQDCEMREGIMGATFTVNTLKGQHIALDYLPKAQARLLYRYAQEREEEMAEYRRQRDLEDARAKAGGGITFQSTPESPKEPKEPEQREEREDDPVTVLKKLKELREHDLISQEEYDKKKAEILSRM